jgi:Cu/Ag efflux protein CusF
LLAIASCNRPKDAAVGVDKDKHYPFTGRIVSVSPADHSATIAGAAIPNYMDAMTMDYPIKSKSDLEKLHPGDQISATVNVSESASYNLTDIKVTGHTDAGKK